MHHYYFGGGREVTLREIGHLSAIVNFYAYEEGDEGAFRRLADQIASKAREEGPGDFYYPFNFYYDFRSIAFSHGGSTVSGAFVGHAKEQGDMLVINGKTTFMFTDDFANPLDVGIEPGGVPYKVSDTWTADFSAEVRKIENHSNFFVRAEP